MDSMLAVPRGDDRRRANDAVGMRRRAGQGLDGSFAASPLNIEDSAAIVHQAHAHHIALESQSEERRREELELEAKRLEHPDLFDLSSAGRLAVNESNVITDANLTAARLLSVRRQQLVGLPFIALVTAPYQDAYYRHHRMLGQTGEPQDCELSLRRGVGVAGVRMAPGRFRARLEGGPQRNADGEMLCSWVTFTDIDAQVRAAEEIRGPFQTIIDANQKQAFEGDASQPDFEIVHAPQTNAPGSGVGVVVRACEVTEREQTDAALFWSETTRTAAERVARVGRWSWEPSTRRVSWSPGMYRLFDVDPGEFDGDFAPVLNSRVHPDDREAVEQATATVARSGGPIPVEYRVVHRDGTEHVIHGDGEIEYDAAGTPIGVVGFYQDVTEQRRAEADVRRSEGKYHFVADNTYDWEWWAAPDGTYAYVSPACERVSGHSAEEFLADPDLLLAITHPDDVAMVREHLRDDLSAQPVAERLEFRIFTTAGEERVVEHCCQAAVDKDGTHLGRRGSNRDITERKHAEEEIKRQNQELLRLNERHSRVNTELLEETASLEEINASVTEIAATDDLTGLANRRTFREHMEKAVSMARRHSAALALVSLDLDGLKRVNDSAGHAAGDEVLVLFAEHLASVCRVEDVPARLGGDEFSLLLPGIDVNGARGLAERVLAGVRACEVLKQRGVTVSAGVAEFSPDDFPDDLLRRSDEALYSAKHGGGDVVAVDGGRRP